MKTISNHPKLAYLALLLWLFASLSGMHGRYCFDGLEAPVAVHFDMVDSHADEAEVTGHIDYDHKPSQVTALKVFNLDLFFLLAALLLVIVWPLVRSHCYSVFNTPLSWLRVAGLRPPLRAPPIVLH